MWARRPHVRRGPESGTARAEGQPVADEFVERASPILRALLQLLDEAVREQASRGPQLGGDFTIDEIEREHVRRVIERHQRLVEAATVLGIDTSTLWRKRKRYDD
jgi:transcriptional regulator with PAS, ATPase and Fis domain